MNEAQRATYRIQLNPSFGFREVAAIAPYLADLGITHVYCSPYLQAHPGSTHGYDVVDHTELNTELGGREGFDEMVRALDELGLKHIVDIVPNHVSIAGRANSRWWDVLKCGKASRFAGWFDIDWDPPHDYLKDKVLVPVLGDDLERCLEKGEIELVRDAEEWILRYHDNEVPVAAGPRPPDVETNSVDLAELLSRQHYVLANWRVAARHLNYRRFFDINTLAALRMEDPAVFEETHRLVLDLIEEGKLDGLRIDHIDGLREPARYLKDLKAASRDTYVVVEKILEGDEELPEEWPVEGTTGYDFLNRVQGLFIDPAAEGPLSSLYADITGQANDLAAITREKRFLVMRHIMASDLGRLVGELGDAFDHESWAWDGDELRVVLAELIAALHVYRTYISPTGDRSPTDDEILRDALTQARSRCTYLDPRYLDRLERILALEAGGDAGTASVLRFQQTTGPIMAKGVEDTVFYNFNRYVVLNEVGGDPGVFGMTPTDFHSTGRRVQATTPLTMLATSTHDTKRSEDMRARLALLSEIPELWAEAVERLFKIGERHTTGDLPDRNTKYLFLQTLVGAWPLSIDRALEYMEKASKEAKRFTSWLDPNPGYEAALGSFIRGALAEEEFTGELERFIEPLIRPGRINSLAQTLIKLTYPGCPDIYQGTELWDLSLVDPDNRRPVDYTARRELLAGADAPPADPLGDDGASKLFLTATALRTRNRHPEAFGARGSYEPLVGAGQKAAHVLGYIRGGRVAVIVPRLILGLEDDWGDTTVKLPDGAWQNAFSGAALQGGPVQLAELFGPFPVALLTRGG
jgi:(1->4)-alpha-D-glucan 1-alpha-D-glucosylmutase